MSEHGGAVFAALPVVLLERILHFADPASVEALSQTCERFSHVLPLGSTSFWWRRWRDEVCSSRGLGALLLDPERVQAAQEHHHCQREWAFAAWKKTGVPGTPSPSSPSPLCSASHTISALHSSASSPPLHVTAHTADDSDATAFPVDVHRILSGALAVSENGVSRRRAHEASSSTTLRQRHSARERERHGAAMRMSGPGLSVFTWINPPVILDPATNDTPRGSAVAESLCVSQDWTPQGIPIFPVLLWATSDPPLPLPCSAAPTSHRPPDRNAARHSLQQEPRRRPTPAFWRSEGEQEAAPSRSGVEYKQRRLPNAMDTPSNGQHWTSSPRPPTEPHFSLPSPAQSTACWCGPSPISSHFYYPLSVAPLGGTAGRAALSTPTALENRLVAPVSWHPCTSLVAQHSLCAATTNSGISGAVPPHVFSTPSPHHHHHTCRVLSTRDLSTPTTALLSVAASTASYCRRTSRVPLYLRHLFEQFCPNPESYEREQKAVVAKCRAWRHASQPPHGPAAPPQPVLLPPSPFADQREALHPCSAAVVATAWVLGASRQPLYGGRDPVEGSESNNMETEELQQGASGSFVALPHVSCSAEVESCTMLLCQRQRWSSCESDSSAGSSGGEESAWNGEAAGCTDSRAAKEEEKSTHTANHTNPDCGKPTQWQKNTEQGSPETLLWLSVAQFKEALRFLHRWDLAQEKQQQNAARHRSTTVTAGQQPFADQSDARATRGRPPEPHSAAPQRSKPSLEVSTPFMKRLQQRTARVEQWWRGRPVYVPFPSVLEWKVWSQPRCWTVVGPLFQSIAYTGSPSLPPPLKAFHVLVHHSVDMFWRFGHSLCFLTPNDQLQLLREEGDGVLATNENDDNAMDLSDDSEGSISGRRDGEMREEDHELVAPHSFPPWTECGARNTAAEDGNLRQRPQRPSSQSSSVSQRQGHISSAVPFGRGGGAAQEHDGGDRSSGTLDSPRRSSTTTTTHFLHQGGGRPDLTLLRSSAATPNSTDGRPSQPAPLARPLVSTAQHPSSTRAPHLYSGGPTPASPTHQLGHHAAATTPPVTPCSLYQWEHVYTPAQRQRLMSLAYTQSTLTSALSHGRGINYNNNHHSFGPRSTWSAHPSGNTRAETSSASTLNFGSPVPPCAGILFPIAIPPLTFSSASHTPQPNLASPPPLDSEIQSHTKGSGGSSLFPLYGSSGNASFAVRGRRSTSRTNANPGIWYMAQAVQGVDPQPNATTTSASPPPPCRVSSYPSAVLLYPPSDIALYLGLLRYTSLAKMQQARGETEDRFLLHTRMRSPVCGRTAALSFFFRHRHEGCPLLWLKMELLLSTTTRTTLRKEAERERDTIDATHRLVKDWQKERLSAMKRKEATDGAQEDQAAAAPAPPPTSQPHITKEAVEQQPNRHSGSPLLSCPASAIPSSQPQMVQRRSPTSEPHPTLSSAVHSRLSHSTSETMTTPSFTTTTTTTSSSAASFTRFRPVPDRSAVSVASSSSSSGRRGEGSSSSTSASSLRFSVDDEAEEASPLAVVDSEASGSRDEESLPDEEEDERVLLFQGGMGRVEVDVAPHVDRDGIQLLCRLLALPPRFPVPLLWNALVYASMLGVEVWDEFGGSFCSTYRSTFTDAVRQLMALQQEYQENGMARNS